MQLGVKHDCVHSIIPAKYCKNVRHHTSNVVLLVKFILDNKLNKMHHVLNLSTHFWYLSLNATDSTGESSSVRPLMRRMYALSIHRWYVDFDA